MESTPATPAAIPSNAPVATQGQQPLPRPVVWTALGIAAALPIILFAVLIIVMMSAQYNFLDWME